MNETAIQTAKKIRIVLVDDHQVLREGLRELLGREPGLEVVGEASNGRSAIELVARLAPDVVVMDVSMAGMNGIEATRRIVEQDPRVRVIGLSIHADRRYVERMFKAGARGYLVKVAGRSEVVQALEAVHAGRFYLAPDLTEIAVEQLVGPAAAKRERKPDSPLGAREREVLQLLAEGLTSKRIAETLGITEKTVETHRRNIMRKTGWRSIAQLTKYAVREGLTGLEN